MGEGGAAVSTKTSDVLISRSHHHHHHHHQQQHQHRPQPTIYAKDNLIEYGSRLYRPEYIIVCATPLHQVPPQHLQLEEEQLVVLRRLIGSRCKGGTPHSNPAAYAHCVVNCSLYMQVIGITVLKMQPCNTEAGGGGCYLRTIFDRSPTLHGIVELTVLVTVRFLVWEG